MHSAAPAVCPGTTGGAARASLFWFRFDGDKGEGKSTRGEGRCGRQGPAIALPEGPAIALPEWHYCLKSPQVEPSSRPVSRTIRVNTNHAARAARSDGPFSSLCLNPTAPPVCFLSLAAKQAERADLAGRHPRTGTAPTGTQCIIFTRRQGKDSSRVRMHGCPARVPRIFPAPGLRSRRYCLLRRMHCAK